MSNKIQEHIDLAEQLEKYIGRIFIHTKSGEWYTFTGTILNEKDLVTYVTYTDSLDEQVDWSRPVDEFFDRFVLKE